MSWWVGTLLWLPIVAKPCAYRIMSIGMREGVFTGKTLSAYLAGDKTDYVNARRIINRLDQADKIAGYAERLQDCLEGALQS